MGLCDKGNESSGSVKCRELPDEVMNCWLLRKDPAL